MAMVGFSFELGYIFSTIVEDYEINQLRGCKYIENALVYIGIKRIVVTKRISALDCTILDIAPCTTSIQLSAGTATRRATTDLGMTCYPECGPGGMERKLKEPRIVT